MKDPISTALSIVIILILAMLCSLSDTVPNTDTTPVIEYTETTAVTDTANTEVTMLEESTKTTQAEGDDSVDSVYNTSEVLEVIIDTQPPTEPTPSYSEEELEILAIIIYQEAGGDACSDDTRRKVGSVFINRVTSSLYPNTFEEVATQEAQYGALHWTGIKWPDRAYKPEEYHAVERAYIIAEELLTSGSILPEKVIFQSQFKQGAGVYCYQDNTYFCY